MPPSLVRPGALSLALIVAACGQPQQQQGGGPPTVTVARPLVRQITDWDEYTARLAAVDSVEVRARVSGYLESVHFRDGAIVEQGDLLFVIDPRPYQAALDEALARLTQSKVRLDLAGRDLVRAQRLFRTRAISEEELDARIEERRQAEAAVQAAEADVQSRSLEVEFTHIKAPIRGRIGRRLVTEGNLISGGSAGATLLTTIVSLDPIYAYFTADESDFLRYMRLDRTAMRPSSRDAATPVKMRLADEDEFVHDGHMDFLDNVVDAETATIQGRAVFENPDTILTPGLFAQVRVQGRGPYEAIMVPDAAIVSDQAERFVYVLGDDGRPARRVVRLGRKEGRLRIIDEGLAADERLVIEGLQAIRPGITVQVEEGEIRPPGGQDGP